MQPQEFASRVHEVQRILTELADVDPAVLPASLVADAVPVLAHVARLADTVTALATRRVETSGVWAESGACSAAAWVERVTDDAGRLVRDRLRAARIVDEHACFGPDLCAGRTSVAHLAAVSRVLHGPGGVRTRRRAEFPAVAEAFATAAANAGPRQLREILDRWAVAVDAEPEVDEMTAFEGRYLTITEYGGEALLEARLPLDDARWLARHLDALVDSFHRDPASSPLGRPWRGGPGGAGPAGGGGDGPRLGGDGDGPRLGDGRVPRAALRLDALLHLAALAEANPDGVPMVDGAPSQVLVVVTLDRLAAARRPGGRPPDRSPPAALWSGRPAPVSDQQARRHACGDAEIRRLVIDPAGVVTELGRAQRIAPRGLRLQVAVRDGVCRYPGCAVPATACQAHHVVHWADGGGTDLATLAAFCRHHHRWLHEGGVTVTGVADDALRFARRGVLLGVTRPRPVLGEAAAG